MRRVRALTTTLLLTAATAATAACSSDDTAPSTTSPDASHDSGAPEAGPATPDATTADADAANPGAGDATNDAAASVADALADTTADDAAVADAAPDDASTGSADVGPVACAPDAGSPVIAQWDFAVSSTVDGGVGQILSVHVCDSVVWVNDDDGVLHSVVSNGGGAYTFTTENVMGTAAGAPFQPVRFPVAGTFSYECGIHGAVMHGQITVTP